jgi:hypothetical protein
MPARAGIPGACTWNGAIVATGSPPPPPAGGPGRFAPGRRWRIEHRGSRRRPARTAPNAARPLCVTIGVQPCGCERHIQPGGTVPGSGVGQPGCKGRPRRGCSAWPRWRTAAILWVLGVKGGLVPRDTCRSIALGSPVTTSEEMLGLFPPAGRNTGARLPAGRPPVYAGPGGHRRTNAPDPCRRRG